MPTHVSAIASYVDGGVSQSVFSFASPLARMGVVEITGVYAERGLGVLDLPRAARAGGKPLTSGEGVEHVEAEFPGVRW